MNNLVFLGSQVVTRAPVECMCRPCSSPNEEEIVAQELVAGLASK